tara:strand:+ start:362 stop:514 length:153 start_codon:yes stop_codon:yes gene_type:complete
MGKRQIKPKTAKGKKFSHRPQRALNSIWVEKDYYDEKQDRWRGKWYGLPR